jgi:hypothetical protein
VDGFTMPVTAVLNAGCATVPPLLLVLLLPPPPEQPASRSAPAVRTVSVAAALRLYLIEKGFLSSVL